MSFILDALKKSESERQEKAPAEFSSLPSSPAARGAPAWLWILGGLLLLNVVVLGVTLASRTREAPVEPLPPLRAEASAPAAASFSDRVERARQRLPVRGAAAGDGEARATPAPPAEPAPAAPRGPNFSLLPSLDELRASGTLSLPELHVDIHVFSEDPAGRFVFINMNKYREQGKLAEGPVVREITRDGVVLDQDGTVFVVLRD